MGIIFCFSVSLIKTFNARSVDDFITKETNIPVNLVPFFNDISFLFCHFFKSGVTSQLKSLLFWKCKNVRVIYSKQGKVLLLKKRYFGQPIYGGPPQLQNFVKKINIWATQSFKFNSLYLKKWQCREHVFLPVNFNNKYSPY